ncbi:MAG: hypothetical protein HGGPFJEG_02672 [Ignavibacteria bacterium]|nr:hypothetical protein [Ignavibacteria bacterium]
MNTLHNHIIYTIGHSTHSIEDFIKMLQSFKIKILIDIRGLPGSRKYPQFNKENLKKSLHEKDIDYIHIQELGGRRKVQKDSKNTRWRSASFQGYADYMETEGFRKGIEELEAIASQTTAAYMCAEAVWWRCHRSMVSDYLKAKGWTVMHITGANKAGEHTYTSPAVVTGDQVHYKD